MIGTRVLVVENDPFTLTSIVNALEYQRMDVVARASSAREALELQREANPTVALLDLDLGVGPTGIDLAHALRIRQPDIGIVILSTYRDPRLVGPGVTPPPRGTVYLSKQDVHDFSQVISSLEAAAETPVARRSTPAAALPSLTEIQLEVLQGIAEGLSTQAIAEQRNVSVKAIEQTISRLYEVFEVPRDGAHNQRVRLARAYLQLAGKVEAQGT
ncbi:MAG: response regulator [Actinomycetes bacterium]